MKDELYVGITKPKEVRRTLLEASKNTVQLLQGYEKIKALRQEKKEETEKLIRTLKEINEAAEEIKKAMPKVDIKKLPKTKPQPSYKPQPKPAKSQKPQAAKPKESPELNELEQELKEIETKLKRL